MCNAHAKTEKACAAANQGMQEFGDIARLGGCEVNSCEAARFQQCARGAWLRCNPPLARAATPGVARVEVSEGWWHTAPGWPLSFRKVIIVLRVKNYLQVIADSYRRPPVPVRHPFSQIPRFLQYRVSLLESAHMHLSVRLLRLGLLVVLVACLWLACRRWSCGFISFGASGLVLSSTPPRHVPSPVCEREGQHKGCGR